MLKNVKIACLIPRHRFVGPLAPENIWYKHILFDQSLLHKYNIIEVGSDSKLYGLLWSFPENICENFYLIRMSAWHLTDNLILF